MNVFGQGDIRLRYTGNYEDQVFGPGYHLEPITFHEFMTKPESIFMFEPEFMQVPAYISDELQVPAVAESARAYVARYIMDIFEHNLLGMQDYVHWASRFRLKCDAVAPAFWSQVNMISLMTAADLEMDESHTTGQNIGNAMRIGGQTVTTDQTGESTTTAHTETTQDVDNTQSTDTSTREGTATTVNAPDQLSNDLEYNWQHAADNVHEVRSRAGDTHQHVAGSTDSESKTDSASQSSSTTALNNSSDNNTNTSSQDAEYTNKMFMQERRLGIETAQALLPLEWLRQQLRPMFYMIY